MKACVLRQVVEQFDPDEEVAYMIWTVDDLADLHLPGRTDRTYADVLSEEQQKEVIHRMQKSKDCSIGLTWAVLEEHAHNVYIEEFVKD